MDTAYRCQLWHPGECTGTPVCPPRCPRFVATDGTPYTIIPEGDGFLAFDASGAAAGTVTQAEARMVSIELDPSVSSELGVELARQAVAHAAQRDDGRFEVVGPAAVIERFADELEVEAASNGRSARVRMGLSDSGIDRLSLAPARFAPTPVPERVTSLVDPSTVAVVGATDRPGSIGRILLENLVATFHGEVLPVSSSNDRLLGLSTVADIAALDGRGVDLAVVAIPSEGVLDAVTALTEVDVSAVAILSAGFGEVDTDGAERERALAAHIGSSGMTAIGPNAIGVLSTRGGLNASFAPAMPAAGGVSVVSHSGAMITAILDWATDAGIGIRDVVSLGNGVDLTAAELVRYWGADPGTSTIIAYLEDLPDGRTFVEAARDVTPSTPIVVLKAGVTAGGANAAASHTGAIAGDDAGYAAAFNAAGVLRAASQQSLFDLVEMVERSLVPMGERVAIVTNAGGPGVIAADAVEAADLTLANFAASTREALATRLPDAAAIDNPVDVLGDASVERFTDALESALADPNVDIAVATTTPHPLVSMPALIEALGDAKRRYGKPIVPILPGGQPPDEVRVALAAADLPLFTDATRAATTLATFAQYGRARRSPRVKPRPIDIDEETVVSFLDEVRAKGNLSLGPEAMDLLAAYGVSTAPGSLARSATTADAIAQVLGTSVAMKVIAPTLAHKTDVGGVETDVAPHDVAETYTTLVERVATAAPEVDIDGVLVQSMVPPGQEFIVGVVDHSRVGPVVTVGRGGVFVEALADVGHGLAPISTHEARQLLDGLDSASLLYEGHRGSPAPDVEALAAAVSRISRLAVDLDEVVTLEVNPIVATPDGAIAIDFYAQLTR